MKYCILILLFFAGLPFAEALSPDTASVINPRTFDPEAIAEASEDYAFQEENENSAWNKFMRAISEFLYDAMTSSSESGNYIYITIGIIFLLIAAFYIMKMQKLWLFADNDEKDKYFETEILKENIHEMDFDKLINEAESKERYNVAVRLLFLKLLKQLNDGNVISWEPNKTNREYYYEIKPGVLRNEYDKVSDYFERVWYGEYFITEGIYKRIKPDFISLGKKSGSPDLKS